jgi:hypothetical protein
LSELLPSKLVENILKEINIEAAADTVKEEPGTIKRKGHLSGKISDELECDPVRPGETDKLVPISGNHVGHVEPDHEGDWDFTRKSKSFEYFI